MSALDARIRKLAREEAERATAPAAVLEASGPDRLTALEKEVADLRARLDAIENAGTTGQDEKTITRRTRKTAGTE